jgi:hypothetical protein
MKKFAIASALTLVSANAALAKPGFGQAVPEISALEGTAALAAVAAIVLLAWERRRRAS